MEIAGATPVIFQCARCPWRGESFAELADHAWNSHPVNGATGDDAPLANPAPPLDLVHRPARPLKSRARRRVAVELELPPSETAPEGAGNAQSAGVRPSTPFARAVDRNRAGDGWKRETLARPTVYCKGCGIALPTQMPKRCGECGKPTA